MTTKPVLVLFGCLLLFSCGQLDSSDNSNVESPINTTITFTIQPMQVTGGNLRLSYVGKTVTDTSVFYQVVSSYEGKSVGFNLSLPTEDKAKARLSSRGGVSDDFLHALEKLYGVKVDNRSRFRDDVYADCYNLSKVYKSDSVQAEGGMNKLVFQEGADSLKPELFLNVNEKEHWIELVEKDTASSQTLLKRLTEGAGEGGN